MQPRARRPTRVGWITARQSLAKPGVWLLTLLVHYQINIVPTVAAASNPQYLRNYYTINSKELRYLLSPVCIIRMLSTVFSTLLNVLSGRRATPVPAYKQAAEAHLLVAFIPFLLRERPAPHHHLDTLVERCPWPCRLLHPRKLPFSCK